MTTAHPEGLISRKRIAEMMGREITPRMVLNNEKLWGLDAARIDLNGRCVRYRMWVAVKILKARGMME